MNAATAREASREHARQVRVLRPARPEPGIKTGRSVAALAAASAIAVIVTGGYIGYVAHYSTNGVYQDEWNWVGLVSKSYAGALTLGDLWAPHNENRMLFPNLIAVLLGPATGFNDLAFIYLGVIFLIVAVALLAFACRRDLLQHPIAYLPAIFVFFSVAQYENSLWAFQFAWFMVVACLAGVLVLLTAPRLDVWRIAGATAIAVLASYSSIEGLTVWAAGLVALLRTEARLKLRATWSAAAVVVAALYVHDLTMEPVAGLPTRLATAIYGFFVAVGSVIPGLILNTRYGTDLSITAVFGVIITVAGSSVAAFWILRGRSDRVLTVAAALVVVGLLFAVMLMPSRLSADVMNGTLSRYTTFTLLVLAGAYLGAVRMAVIATEGRQPRRMAGAGALAGVLLALVCIQVAASTRAGILGGITTYSAHSEAANLTANYTIAPRTLVGFYAYATSYGYFETQAGFLEANHLNVFGDGESAYYQQVGVLDGGVVRSPLPVPPEFGPVHADPAEWRAWLALSSVYEQRPDLQLAFPGPTVASSRRMVAWTVQSGLDPSDPGDAEVLQPYATQYRTWLAEEAH